MHYPAPMSTHTENQTNHTGFLTLLMLLLAIVIAIGFIAPKHVGLVPFGPSGNPYETVR